MADNFDERLRDAWARHHDDVEDVSARMDQIVQTADPGQAVRACAFVQHFVGEQLGDWPRAAQLCARAIDGLKATPDVLPAIVRLAACSELAGDQKRAEEALEKARQADAEAARSGALDVRLDVFRAQGLAAQGAWARAAEAHARALSREGALGDDPASHRLLAVASNDLASRLLDLAGRGPELDAAMERAARAAREHWLRAGTWENDERADYLLALVMNALGRHADAEANASRGIATIAANGPEPVDLAFLHLALAVAHRGLGHAAEQAQALAHADELAAAFDERSLREGFASERAKHFS